MFPANRWVRRCKVASGLAFTCASRSVAGAPHGLLLVLGLALLSSSRRRRCPRGGTRREPFNPTPMGVNPTSFGSPHVRPTGVRRTCGEPDETMKNTHPEDTTARCREQARPRAHPPPGALRRHHERRHVPSHHLLARLPSRSLPTRWGLIGFDSARPPARAGTMNPHGRTCR